MKRRLAITLIGFIAACAQAHGKLPAKSGSVDDKQERIEKLRAKGPAELDKLLAEYNAMEEGTKKAALAETIDAVAGQRYAHVSGLYWYTDLDDAKAAAKTAAKPILSLRMLGRLDVDLSCVNSRYFRVALYANEAVAKVLREKFVLHWSSERDVPRVTIEFGDGRVLERTVGGNSAHYVLDSTGRAVDVIPGLYGPAAFIRELEAVHAVALKAAALDGAARATLVAAYHTERVAALQTIWQEGANAAYMGTRLALSQAVGNPSGTIYLAEARTVGKGVYERPLVLTLQLGLQTAAIADESPFWEQVGAQRAQDGRLDERSKKLMRALAPTDWAAVPKALDDTAFEQLVSSFERSIAGDTALAELKLHWTIHQWFIADQSGALASFGALNKKVYTELFLTPGDDAWLGMATRDVFSGLPRDGILVARAER